MLNRSLFAQTITMLFELYEKNPSKPIMNIYYEVLKEMEDADFQNGVMELLKTRVYPTMPKPAEILQYKPQEPIINIEDRVTLKAKELISFCETANSQIDEYCKENNIDFMEHIRNGVKLKLSDEDIVILDNVKGRKNHKELIINIRVGWNSSEQLAAFKKAIKYSESYSGAIENCQVRKMIKGKDDEKRY